MVVTTLMINNSTGFISINDYDMARIIMITKYLTPTVHACKQYPAPIFHWKRESTQTHVGTSPFCAQQINPYQLCFDQYFQIP